MERCLRVNTMKFDIPKGAKMELQNKGRWNTIKNLPSKEIRDFLHYNLKYSKTAGLHFKLSADA